MVALVDATYFTRRYCQEELAVALAAHRKVRAASGPQAVLGEALLPIVVAAGPDLDDLPAELRDGDWSPADDTGRLVELVLRRLDQVAVSFALRLDGLGETARLRDRLLEAISIPAVRPLAGVPVYHESGGLPDSIEDKFVGRGTQLWELHTGLASRESGAAALTTTLEGGGGFGKTRLALEYVHRYGAVTYPGGVLWLNADVSPDRLEAQQHGILRELRPRTPDLGRFRTEGREVAAELGEALRERSSTSRVLYVVDNVPEPEAGEPARELSRYCPAPGQVSLLVSSRARQVGLGNLRRVEVGELAEESAVRLLTWELESREEITAASWREIAVWAGGLALALELLNALVRSGAMRPGELLVACREGGGPTAHTPGVGKVLEVPYRRLPEGARRAAHVLAWMAPDPIPATLLSDDDLFPPEVRATLRTRSFVTGVRSGKVELYGRMHRVVADFLRGAGGDPAGDLDLAVAALHSLVYYLTNVPDPADWPLLTIGVPHAEAVLERSLGALTASVARLRTLNLGFWTAGFLRIIGRYEAAERWGRRCLAAARETLGEEHELTVAVNQELAAVLQAAGRPGPARELLDDVPDGLDGQDSGLLTAARKVVLAVTLIDQGDLGGARQVLEEVVHQYEETLAVRPGMAAWVMSILGWVLFKQDELTQARDVLERAMDIERRAPGTSLMGPWNLLILASLLASTLYHLGDEARAGELLIELDGLRKAAQAGRAGEPDVWDLLVPTAEETRYTRLLTWALERKEQETQAAVVREQVLELSKAVFGEQSPFTLGAMADVGNSLRAAGDLAAAVELLAQAVEVARRDQGDESSGTLRANVRLAQALEEQGEWERAGAIWAEVLGSCRKRFGEEHPVTLDAMSRVATALRHLRELPAARELLERVHEVCRRTLGEEHPNTIAAALDLARFMVEDGDLAAARQLAEDAVESSHGAVGPEHLRTWIAVKHLDAIRGMQEGPGKTRPPRPAPSVEAADPLELAMAQFGGERRTVEELRVMLDRSRRERGDEDAMTLRTLASLGLRLAVERRHDETVELVGPALPAIRRVLGEGDHCTVFAVTAMGVALAGQGDTAGAGRLLEEARQRCAEALSEQRPFVLGAVVVLLPVLLAQGREAETAALLEQALTLARKVFGDAHQLTQGLKLWKVTSRVSRRIDRDTVKAVEDMAAELRAGNVGPGEGQAGAVSIEELRNMVEKSRQAWGGAHPLALAPIAVLGTRLQFQGENAKAIELLEPNLPAIRRVVGEDQGFVQMAMAALGAAFFAQGDLARAEALLEETLGVCRSRRDEEDMLSIAVMRALGLTLLSQGKTQGSAELLERAWQASRIVHGEEDRVTLELTANLAGALAARREIARSIELLEQAIDVARRTLPEGDPFTAMVLDRLPWVRSLGQ